MTEAFAIAETAAWSSPFLLNTATACYKDVGYDFYLNKINSVTVLQYEPRREKTVFGVCDQMRHKPACTVTKTG